MSKKITFQVNNKKISITTSLKAFNDFCYMNSINDLKKRVRYAINHNENNKQDLGIASWGFIASEINYPSYRLFKVDNTTFNLEEEESIPLF